jgi:hypothetical protein
MIILRLTGGLGNQMFQYAFGRAAANRLGVEMVLDVSDSTLTIHQGFELNRVFNIQARVATEYDMRAVLGWLRSEIIRKILRNTGLTSIFSKHWIVEPHFHFSPEMLKVPDETYLSGYWQSEKYFAVAAESIRGDFTFRIPPSKGNEVLANAICDDSLTAISLHVRRGDYVNNPSVNQVHGGCTVAYYHAGMQHLAERVRNPFFYVFSDDMEWVSVHLELPFPHRLVTHNRGESSYEDMRLMSLCRHHIVANSSFSWWGAWLNPLPEKIVVAPRNWFVDKSRTHDLFPPGWVTL